jgi:hypothetical protein
MGTDSLLWRAVLTSAFRIHGRTLVAPPVLTWTFTWAFTLPDRSLRESCGYEAAIGSTVALRIVGLRRSLASPEEHG